MGLIVDTLDRIARHCSIQKPSSWITAQADEYLEIRDDFLREYDVDGNPRPTFIPQNATGCISATWQDKYVNHANHAMNIHNAMRAGF